MEWEDRVQEAAYTGPDGTRIAFDFEDVSMVLRKQTTAHEFTSLDSTYVEDQGLKGSQYPMRVYFHGDRHDIEAKAFLDLLAQRGPGRLEHPFYGTHVAIPFGDIQRSDALTTAANQTIFTLTFWETISALYPSADDNTLALVDDAVNSYDDLPAQQFEDSLDVDGAAENATFGAEMKALKNGASDRLKAAQDGAAELTARMARIDKAIDSTIDTFVGGPLLIAAQMRRLVGAPARSKQLLRARLDAYAGMAARLIAGKGTGAGGGTGTSSTAGTGVVEIGIASPRTIAEANNRFHANRMVAEVAVLAVAQAVTGETYRTRQHALDAAVELATIHDSIVDWSEANYSVLFDASAGPSAQRPNSTGVGAIDVGDARQVLVDVVTRSMAYLIAESFKLGIERTVLLESPRTIIDILTELYGEYNEELMDEFIAANDFNGDELLELPPGTVIRYYVD